MSASDRSRIESGDAIRKGRSNAGGTRRSMRVWLRRIALVSASASVLAIIVLWMLIQRKPAWYRPVVLDEAVLREVRRDTATVADEFGDRLVAGLPFELVLTDTQLTAWLAAGPSIWPEIARDWPPEVSAPSIRFRPGSALIAALLESNGWRVIATAHLEPIVSEDQAEVRLRLRNLYAGSIPLPDALLQRLAESLLVPYSKEAGNSIAGESARQRASIQRSPGSQPVSDPHDIDRLLTGQPLRNHFVWPNGRRTFHIRAIAIEEGLVRVAIQPLDR